MTIIERIKDSAWLKAAGVRAIRTMIQSALAYAATVSVLWEVSWQGMLSAAILGGLTSLLESLGGLPEVSE